MTCLQRRSTLPSSVLLLATLMLAVTAINGQEDIDKAISEVFPPPNPTNPTPSDGAASGGCTCVPYYLCNNNSINTDGAGLIDIRIKDGPCASYMDVCCDQPTNPSNAPPMSNEDKRMNCGHWNAGGVGFRITGHTNEAQFGEFPWMVAILKTDSYGGKNYSCGGSLIHPRVVLTAVHCVYDKSPHELVVRAGEWDSQTENELFPFQDAQATKIIKHEKYYGGALHNDVALIIVEKPFILRDNVGTICLPTQGFTFSRERCYASGWGKNVFGKAGVYQAILKKIDLPIVPRSKCTELLRRTRLGPNYKLHESFICAGGEVGKDTCQGDGGSPLMCPLQNNPEQFHQAGMVAWGIGCGDQTPGVYVDVALFRRWIDDQMIKHDLDMSYYDANFIP